MRKICKALADTGALWESAFLSADAVPFRAEVRAACEKNYCGCFGKCWNCPPGVGEWEALRDEFHRYGEAFVFSTRHLLEDSFDLDSMNEGRVSHERLARDLKKTLTEAGYTTRADFELLGAGGCHICPVCSYPDAPCRHPELVFRSMEACGIDVVSLSASCGMHYINGENTVTYFSILFFNEK